jgi:hypothetical protein
MRLISLVEIPVASSPVETYRRVKCLRKMWKSPIVFIGKQSLERVDVTMKNTSMLHSLPEGKWYYHD